MTPEAALASITQCLDTLPRWSRVALLSRLARHVQGAVADFDHDQQRLRNADVCELVHRAVSALERSAREGQQQAADPELYEQLLRVAESPAMVGKANAASAIRCAAHATWLAARACDPGELALGGVRLIESGIVALKPRSVPLIVAELQAMAARTAAQNDKEPAPAHLLTFLDQQAVHEAGHVVMAYLLRLPIDSARIIYSASMNLVHDPYGEAEPSDERLASYRLVYAAGTAAEQVLFGEHRDWAAGLDHEDVGSDRQHHFYFSGQCVSAEGSEKRYADDVAHVAARLSPWKEAIRGFADLLLKERSLRSKQINETLEGLGLPRPY